MAESGASRSTPIKEIQRTILFSDVVSSTELICREGNQRWLAYIDRHGQTIRAIASGYAGEVCGFAGDGFMVAFLEPARAVACALRLQTAFAIQGLGIRVGLEQGPVIPFDNGGGYVGLTPHVAARLTSLCTAGQVIMSEECYLAARQEVALPVLEQQRVDLRGLSRTRMIRVSNPVSWS